MINFKATLPILPVEARIKPIRLIAVLRVMFRQSKLIALLVNHPVPSCWNSRPIMTCVSTIPLRWTFQTNTLRTITISFWVICCWTAATLVVPMPPNMSFPILRSLPLWHLPLWCRRIQPWRYWFRPSRRLWHQHRHPQRLRHPHRPRNRLHHPLRHHHLLLCPLRNQRRHPRNHQSIDWTKRSIYFLKDNPLTKTRPSIEPWSGLRRMILGMPPSSLSNSANDSPWPISFMPPMENHGPEGRDGLEEIVIAIGKVLFVSMDKCRNWIFVKTT
mmetsp:Transcript_33462/g.81019  ORF Transcript_33462/g.81019 Transcript_33462/m.81019 type:complete len:273 (+) Transcript_33462:1552-2370(+)